MGLVFRGMLWCYCFKDFVKSLFCYCQNGRETPKTLGVLMDKQNHPTFPEHPGASNNYANYKKKCGKLNFGLARVTIQRAQIGHETLCSFPRAEQLYFETNAYRTTFHHGKSVEKYMKSLIIDDILSGGRECFKRVLSRKFQSDRIKVQSKRCYQFLNYG